MTALTTVVKVPTSIFRKLMTNTFRVSRRKSLLSKNSLKLSNPTNSLPKMPP